jgi:adenine phosphoribosyltransferase
MKDTYTLNVAGLTRELPICPVNEHLDIAALVMFTDVELTVACAAELVKRVPEHDVILTAEAKGIPLAYEMARQLNERYVVARKGLKLYMKDPIKVDVKSITTMHMQTLYIDKFDIELLKGKRVLIVDDVISTGESLNSLIELAHVAGGNIVGIATVLAEGDAAKRDDIIFLEELPLFEK